MERGGSIIVRRLICLLYTAGRLLSGIPFYGTSTVYVGAAAARDPLANATHVVTSRRPLSSRCNPGAPLRSGRFRLVRDEHGDMGSSNRVSLDTPRPGPLFNRVWSLPPGRWFALRRVNVLFLHSVVYDAHFEMRSHLTKRMPGDEYATRIHIYVTDVPRNISHFFI